ncbi:MULTISPECIES: hypothetical protein [Paenibacillus]|uniref:Uncharacterized protein n=2 Tax=Paenibacillus TaxID=44249 RepID=A0A2T6FUK5_9BACL|nr:hypothetical protein [Paenibacillus elgii]PUA35582.1 hypothetical protein C8Z91_29665 [Paenibacillus elgii]
MENLPFIVSTYARNIIIFGVERFTPRDGFKGIAESYYQDVTVYAARKYYIDDLDAAKEKEWITQKEYDDIISLKTPKDLTHRPAAQ